MKEFAKEYGFNYVHELYYGEFISWEHCFSFANSPMYGEQQEGIVIKNQTALAEERGPHILKYVNPSFKETQRKNHRQKVEDPNKTKEKQEAEEYMRMIVTEARVMKIFHKMIDEGIAILQKVGEHGGKLCSKVTMEIIKKKLGV